MKKRISASLLTTIVSMVMLVSCSDDKQSPSDTDHTNKSDDQTLANNKQLTEERLRRFDSLDFQFYTNQMWDSLAISHDANIKVYYPDGTTSRGLFPQHIDLLKPLFVFAPNTKITSHPIRFGTGDWTAVVGEMEGTFSHPMPIGNGKTLPPTWKKFKLSMCTLGHWRDGKMIEEHLFWDNQSLINQIGSGK